MSRIKFDPLSEESLKCVKTNKRNKSSRTIKIVQEEEFIEEEGSAMDKENTEAVDPLEKLKERLLNAIDGAEEKSAKIRTHALKSICDILIHNYVPELFENRKIGFSEIIENSLHHGKATEQSLAARIRLLLQFQLGDDFNCPKAMDVLITNAFNDQTNDFTTRAECCHVLALLHFIKNYDTEDLIQSMQMFEHIFHNQESKQIAAEESVLYSAALLAWGLMLSKIPSADIRVIGKKLKSIMSSLVNLLESSHLNLRVIAGETICLVLECGRIENDSYMHDVIPNLIAITKTLSTDSQRHRHKQELKSQRATFRDILRYIEDNIQPNIKIQIGSEPIGLNSWAFHQQYMAICTIIGPGIVAQLSNNQYIRDLLELGELPDKPKKLEKKGGPGQCLVRRKNRQNKNKPDSKY